MLVVSIRAVNVPVPVRQTVPDPGEEFEPFHVNVTDELVEFL